MGWGWVGKFCKKTICTSFDRSSLILDRSSQADLHSKSCRTLDSNFTEKHTLSKSKTKTQTVWSWFANITNWSSNTFKHKVVDPNTFLWFLYASIMTISILIKTIYEINITTRSNSKLTNGLIFFVIISLSS